MRSRVLTVLLALLTLPVSSAIATKTPHWDYSKLTTEADLIVIATAVETNDLKETTEIAYGSEKYMVVGVETKFKVLGVLKGQLVDPILSFHHYRLKKRTEVTAENGVLQLVRFRPNDQTDCMLFLKKESSSKYTPVTGQFFAQRSVRLIPRSSLSVYGFNETLALFQRLSSSRTRVISKGQMALVETSVGSALFEFLEFGQHSKMSDSASPKSKVEEVSATYRWRFRDVKTEKESSGRGQVMTKKLWTQNSPSSWIGKTLVDERYVKAGPLAIEWSTAGGASGHLYFKPGEVRLYVLPSADFDTFDLSEVY